MSQYHVQHSFSIPQIRFIPERLKPWVMILFITVFNCTGGVYLAAVNEMVGSTQLMREDVMMAGYASLVGMALFFAIMFRLKWAVRPKTTLGCCIPALLVANLISMHTTSVPLLVGVSLVAGFIRMWAIYECNSTIQLWITPKRDMSIWFCYIYLMVNTTIQITGLAALGFSMWISWQYMHWCIIGILLVLYLVVIVCYRGRRIMPRLPLLGVDWIGLLLWATTALSVLFVAIYGEHYEWWSSEPIRFATALGVVSLGLNLWRATFLRHPYISLQIFRIPIVPISVMIILLMDLLLAPSHIFEHLVMEQVLGFDTRNILTMNWVAIAGVVTGVLFTWQTFARRRWTYQRMLVIAFSLFAFYLAYCYFRIDYNIDKEMLYLPIFLRSAGYVIVAILLLTANTRLPFPFVFLHGLSFQNLFSAALAGPIGTAIVGRVFTVVMRQNMQWLGESIDTMSQEALRLPAEALDGMARLQAMLVAMKEIYGYLLLVAIATLIGLTLRYSGIRPRKVIEPAYRSIYRAVRQRVLPRIRLYRLR